MDLTALLIISASLMLMLSSATFSASADCVPSGTMAA